MRKHTKEFKSSISTFGRELDSKITVIGTNLVLGKEDLYSVKPITNATLLKTVMKEVDFESKKQIGIGQEVNIKSGVKVNNEYEYIDYGNYSVYKSEYKAETDTYSHICYDKMLKTMIDYAPLNITYPINLREYITAIATKCGLEFADKNSTFANYNTSINEDHFSNGNYTFRDVLDYIAQLVGGWFCINDNDELDIRYPELAKNYGVASGENVSFISNAEDEINTIIVDGKSTQETRSGKNLFDVNYTYKVGQTFSYKGVTITFDENGYITLNGTADSAGDLNIVTQGYTITLDKDIYLCFEALSGSISNLSRGVSVQAINKSGASIWNYGANANNPIMKVPYSDIVSIKWIRVPLVVGLSFNNYKFRFWVSIENSLNYEPYGVMPSPDYPSEVECVKGKNLFDGVMESGGINNTTGNNQANDSLVRSKNYVSVKPNTTYIISNNGVGVAMNVLEYASDKSFVAFTGLITAGKPFTTSSTTRYIRFYRSASNADKIQLEKGTVATNYVPYNNIQIKDVGKNLFDENNLNFFSKANGKVEINNHVITMTALKTVSSNELFVIGKIDDSLLVNGESYTISSVNVSGMAQSFRLQLRNKDGSYVPSMPASATITYDDTYSLYVINNPFSTSGSTVIPTGTVAIVKNIQVEKGSTATSYEPYQSQTLNINLQGNELCSRDDVKDELIIKNGRAKIIKRIGKREDNIVSNVTNTYTNIKYYQMVKPTDYERYNKYNYADDTLFTHASTKNTTTTWNSEININKMVGGASAKFFWIGFPLETTLEQAQELLSNNCLYYALAEEQEIDLGEVNTLNTYNGVNNISLNASMNSNMEITYTAEYEEFDKHFLKDVNVSFSKKYGAINSVVFSRGGGSDNIYRKDNASINKNGLTEIKIADNPFLEGNDRENFIQPLFDKINGLEFYLMDINSTGIMYMELGDLYYFNIIEDRPSLKCGLVKSGMRKAQGSSGGKYLCLLMNDEIKITQGLEESIYNDEPEITETDYKTASITDTSIKNAIIQTNKNSAEILLKVNNDEVVSAINLSPEKVKIDSAKLDVDAIATFTNSKLAEAGSTVINGANITTGSISCDRLSGGTISGQTISGGTITGSQINATSGNIGGFNIDGSSGFASDYGALRPNGNLLLYPDNAKARYVLSNAMTYNAQTGVVIASNCDANISAPATALDLKACYGADAYLGCMINKNGTGERSGITCSDGVLAFRSTGYCTYNGNTVFGSSSKATKENIEDLSQEKKEEVYKLIKDIPTKQYDYKKEYGKPFNYGFIIEDIENTKLKELLHITQAENNKDIKMYSTEDLVRLELIVIQELMKKIDNLEQKVFILEKERESEDNAKN